MSGSHTHLVSELKSQLRGRFKPLHKGIEAEEDAGLAPLPVGKIPASGLLEWHSQDGGSAGSLAFAMGAALIQPRSQVVVIDPERRFHPPAILRADWQLEQFLVVRPASMQEALWAAEQALRCRGVGAVFCLGLQIPRFQSNTIYRRLLLAAETGQTRGFLIHYGREQSASRWADVRWRVKPLPSSGFTNIRRMQIQQVGGRFQGGVEEGNLDLEVTIEEQTGRISYEPAHRLPVVASLADSMLSPAKARA